MNKLFIVTILFLFSCSNIEETKRSTILTGIDFREFTKKGFLFTPEKYIGEYESIGIINLTFRPEVKKNDFSQSTDYENWIIISHGWIMERLDARHIVSEYYRNAVLMGADAVTDFKITVRDSYNGELLIPIYDATGFAIKRVHKN